MEKPDLNKLIIYVSRPRKKAEESYEQLLRSIAILGYCLDRRLEQQGQEPVYESVFKRAHGKTSEGKPITIIVESGGDPLLEPAAKVAEELSKQFRQHASPVEWRARTRMFQHVSVKDLQDIKEGMLQTIERLKHAEDLQEINSAFNYVKTNMPELKLGTLEEESKNWLDVMLTLKEAGFSFYAAKEAANIFTLGEEHTSLPSTWNDDSLKTWRLMDQTRTQEKEAREAESQKEKKQRKTIEPFLTGLIREGKTNMEIETILNQQKKPRQLISALMQDVTYLRHSGVTQAKPPKIQVVMSSAKDPSMQLPKCPEGQYWNHELEKCMPIKPPEPEPEKEQAKPEPWNKPTIISKDVLDSLKKPSY
jgi:hypothetical protein